MVKILLQNMRHSAFILFLALVTTLTSLAAEPVSEQENIIVSSPLRPRYEKLSPMLRKIVRSPHNGQWSMVNGQSSSSPQVFAFVKVKEGGEAALQENGCRLLEQVGDICIAAIPKSRIGALSLDSRILRVEANRGTCALTDTVAQVLNVARVREGLDLPQAFTGRGVVVGVMDIGFDLTHPTFYSRDTTEYRIKRFWDMLSSDTVGSLMPVGRDFTGRDQLLAVAHARDGLDQTHGTHTLGIAAGSGYDSPYQGMAPESDICIVANAVTDDTIYIDPADYEKYTFALDALGFKYIFDYAESQGKPCVINFSEGSPQDFYGYDQLYYEMLQRLTGPGRIIVSAAGNNGHYKNWICKQAGIYAAGTFLRFPAHDGMVTIKGDGPFTVRLVAYEGDQRDTLLFHTDDVVARTDSVLTGRLATRNDSLRVSIEAYPSCYNSQWSMVNGQWSMVDAYESCYVLSFQGSRTVGGTPKISLEVLGFDANVNVYRITGLFYENSFNPSLTDGDNTHGVLSPSTAPCVISVGSTAYRQYVLNYNGQWHQSDSGTDGIRAYTSSVGPTFDGRIKPEVMAPGINIISSYSSYYLENHPGASDINWDVAHFDFNGRTYPWNSNSGTSMSSPVVAGIIALWLEACPTLSPDDVRGIFERTCRQYDPSLSYPNNYYGYGEIDAYRGLLDVLGIDKISQVSSAPTQARVSVAADGRLEVQLPPATSTANGQWSMVNGQWSIDLQSPTTVSVYSLKGQLLAHAYLHQGDELHRLSLPPLRSGDICVVQIDGPARYSGSSLIKIP